MNIDDLEKINIRPSLLEKIYDSMNLLFKALPVAKKYDPDNGFYLAFSGGKDSQALYHIAQLAQVPFKAHMMLTSVDPHEVILFIKRQYPDVVLHKPKDSIYNLAVKKKFLLPSRIIRWCCAELKEVGGAGTVCLTGIRKQESVKRSKRQEVEVSNRSFAGDFEAFEKWSYETISKKLKTLNQDQFAQHKSSEVQCINGKDKIIVNPMLDWTEHDVWEFLNKVVKVPHCELYDQGWKRIGCICCPMSNQKTKIAEMERWPHVKRNWIKAIKRIRQDKDIKNMLTLNDFGDGTEDEICESVFNWWISGKSYKVWYADEIQQLKLKL